uniref:Putative secreted protein n=1 Tax=Nyssomyia neivai TaxID=330878 RepID=A0A1L8DNK7_9DIPT
MVALGLHVVHILLPLQLNSSPYQLLFSFPCTNSHPFICAATRWMPSTWLVRRKVLFRTRCVTHGKFVATIPSLITCHRNL